MTMPRIFCINILQPYFTTLLYSSDMTIVLLNEQKNLTLVNFDSREEEVFRLSKEFAIDKPIFRQVREIIEDQVVNRQLKEEEQIPSTNQLVNFYKINHATVTKGVNQLVDEGILYKKRGIGVFVASGAREKLLIERRNAFVVEYILPLVEEAHKLSISENEIIDLIKNNKREG
jgi:GntR family transcriptional regulator